MHVDPRVGERVGPVEDQGHRQEVAVAKAGGGGRDRGGHARRRHPRHGGQRQRRDDLRRPRTSRRASTPRPRRRRRSPARSTGVSHSTRPPSETTRSRIASHIWPGPEPRVVELADQRAQRARLVVLDAPERRAHRLAERQPADPLRRPFGAQLVARHAPHLLRVGREEHLVQPPAEAPRDPLLERVGVPGRRTRAQIGPQRARQLDRPQVAHDVDRVERVGEHPPAVADARHPRPDDQLVAQDLLPQRLHLGVLGEEPVAAQIEAETVAFLGPREAADERLALENGHAATALHEVQRGGQAGRAGP